MHEGSRSGVRRRAVATVVALFALVVTGWALPGSTADALPVTGLDPAGFLELPDGAIDIQTARSRGGSVAYLYSVEDPDTNVRALWVRVKSGAAWAAPVMVSHPDHSAYRPSIDVLGDGAALVAWEEDLVGTPDQIVVRRVDGGSAGARREIPVDPYDGPYVSSGPTRDVVAWTRYSVDAHKAFAAVAPTGGAFGAVMPVSDPGWSGSVVDGSLSVSADAGRLHALFLKRDDSNTFYEPAWATYDSVSSPNWKAFELTSSYQDGINDSTPRLGVDGSGHAVLAVGDKIDGWHGEAYVFHPPPPEAVALPDFDVREHLSAAVHLGSTSALGVVERGGSVDALLGGTVPTSARVQPSTGSGVEAFPMSATRPECTSAPWVLVETDFICADHPDPYGSKVEIWSDATGLLGELTPSVGATQVTVSTPNVAVPLLLVKENRTNPDPLWILDLSSDDTGSPPSPLPPPPEPQAPTFVMTGAPTVTGKAIVGRKLRAYAGSWQPAPSSVGYRWYVGKKVIKAATGPKLRLASTYRGKRVRVLITVTRAGYPPVVTVAHARGRVRR
jgi:hypothetical protein